MTNALASPALASPLPAGLAHGRGTLVVEGHGLKPRTLHLSDLRALPRHELADTNVLCLTGREVARMETVAGCRLTDVLDLVGLAALHRAELKQCIVTAEGLDGYKALFSWNELHNSPVGDKALVLYERDGSPLSGPLGDLCLISANDHHLGPRHLRELCRISVRML